jgi:hypothetical protein
MSFEAMDNVGAKTASGRSKRISVGRTRRIWSEASTKYSKPTLSSFLTGKKFDASAYKRPKDIKVSVILNGNCFASQSMINLIKNLFKSVIVAIYLWINLRGRRTKYSQAMLRQMQVENLKDEVDLPPGSKRRTKRKRWPSLRVLALYLMRSMRHY